LEGKYRVRDRVSDYPDVLTAPGPTARDVGDRRLGSRIHDPDDRLRHVRNRLGSDELGVPLAYLVALVAMVFTAISYGRMTRVYPSAGSA